MSPLNPDCEKQPIKMKYIFFGTPDVAKETLEGLVAAGLRPAAVVTNPDAPKGRGHLLTSSPVSQYARSHNIPVLTPEKLDDIFQKEVGAYGADLAIVVAYGKILPESLINSFKQGVLNVHYSLLPRWRGASPVETALLNGDELTGVTIQKMVKKLDAGDIIASREMPIRQEDTTATLRPSLIKLGTDLLVDTLPKYIKGEITPIPQDEALATHARKFSKSDGEIILTDDSLQNWRKYRAFVLWPGTHFFINRRRVKITKATFQNGEFLIERVVPEGKHEIPYNEFTASLKDAVN